MGTRFADPAAAMTRALQLAAQGAGWVEPNPQVGAVVVDSELNLLGEGYHERYGGPHAEVQALVQAGPAACGATLFVTLEPCCHFGKTPPCTQAILRAGIRRVVVAQSDPFPQVSGQGIAELRAAGVEVECGLLEAQARSLTAPFRKLIETGTPWVIAKWAMTLDGKIATRTGSSQWISNSASRAIVHQLRGRMDAIVVGSGTALADDPQLTARPPGPRRATRVVLDRRGRLPLDSALVRTARETPVLLVTTVDLPADRAKQYRDCGVELWCWPSNTSDSLLPVLQEFGRRRCTNVLIEGGSDLLGAFWDQQLIDEVQIFIASKLVGGTTAASPIGGRGLAEMGDAGQLTDVQIQQIEGDLFLRGRLSREEQADR